MTRSRESTWCRWDGYIMRSLAESRVAQMLTRLGVTYLYEHMPYDFTGYLPDFYLPALDTFVEVKGAEPTREEVEKCERLHDQTGCPVLLVYGKPNTFLHHDIDDGYTRVEVSWQPRLLVAGRWLELSCNTLCRAIYHDAGPENGAQFVSALSSQGAGPGQPIGPYAVKWIHDLSRQAGRPCRMIYEHNEPLNAEKIASMGESPTREERIARDFLNRFMEKAA